LQKILVYDILKSAEGKKMQERQEINTVIWYTSKDGKVDDVAIMRKGEKLRPEINALEKELKSA
jgi:hypothetical protein